jgi:hypothetical protein
MRASLRASASNSHTLLNIPLLTKTVPLPFFLAAKGAGRDASSTHRPIQDKHNVLEWIVPSSRKPRWVVRQAGNRMNARYTCSHEERGSSGMGELQVLAQSEGDVGFQLQLQELLC